ncbi:MAG: hypothetical protein HZB46_07630 [Solirubrobacterales bacterium]|nr:hypothetical protein [Solirubrobacterales bacterium]
MAKKDDKKKAKGASPGGIVLAAHPRARRDIALAKGWGGLGVFALVVYLSVKAGVPAADALLRGIVFGMGGYVVGWGLAVAVWRHLALAEIEAARRRLRDAHQEQQRRLEAAAEGGGQGAG